MHAGQQDLHFVQFSFLKKTKWSNLKEFLLKTQGLISKHGRKLFALYFIVTMSNKSVLYFHVKTLLCLVMTVCSLNPWGVICMLIPHLHITQFQANQ